jgi:hypothetical protein
VGVACGMNEEEEESQKERDHWEDQDVDRWIIFT